MIRHILAAALALAALAIAASGVALAIPRAGYDTHSACIAAWVVPRAGVPDPWELASPPPDCGLPVP